MQVEYKSKAIVILTGEPYRLFVTHFNNAGERPATTVVPSKAAPSALLRPEFFRLPKSGGDPYFGLGRSYYYEGEKEGYWKLIRLRKRGRLRGVTLVPYDDIAAFIRKQRTAKGLSI